MRSLLPGLDRLGSIITSSIESSTQLDDWLAIAAFFVSSSLYCYYRQGQSNANLTRTIQFGKDGMGPRGRAALEEPSAPYLDNLMTAMEDPCHVDRNPKGYIALCVAENKLVLDLVAERFMQSVGSGFADSSVYTYSSFLGMPVAREAAAYFMARHFLWPSSVDVTAQHALRTIQPKHIGLGAGCASLIHNLVFLLGQEGDSCLIPAPYYAAFENDVNLVAQIRPCPIEQAHPAAGPTVEELQATFHLAKNRHGWNPKFILITNPNNPLGTIYSPTVLLNVVEWARRNGIHVIVDEVFALSTHFQDSTFQSIIRVLDNQLGMDVHVLWSVSKDFGCSGLRCGLVYTQNETLMKGLEKLSIFTCVSGPIQYLVAELLTDDMFCDYFFRESRARIRASYEICVSKLNEMVLPFVPAEAGLFVYVDFSSLLSPNRTFEKERRLSDLLFQHARLVLTPGESQRDANPGMFRICYAWVSPDVLRMAMERLSRFVAKLRRNPDVWIQDDPRAFAGILQG